MSTITKVGCFIIGWKPEILQNCTEVSHAMLKKYLAAITILSIIWGIIGWSFADRYLKMDWYGSLITSFIFIIVIVCIERYIIQTHGKLKLTRWFRVILAILMAVLGSTIFDQIVFQKDVEKKMREILTEQINSEIPKRSLLFDDGIKKLSVRIDTINNENQKLYVEINQRPYIPIYESSITKTKTDEIDENGKPIYNDVQIINKKNVLNPKMEQVQRNDELLKEYRAKVDTLEKQRLNIADVVRNEYENADRGFLEELNALYSLLGDEWVARAFYIFLFLFLMCLELLVITIKGIDKCDYDSLLEFQLKQKKRELELLDNQLNT